MDHLILVIQDFNIFDDSKQFDNQEEHHLSK